LKYNWLHGSDATVVSWLVFRPNSM
jgi:hypothetical protein